jgi:excisionase family DNA binding protein
MELLTVSCAARIANRSEGTIRAWADEGRLPCIRTTSGRRLFDPAELQRVIAKLDGRQRG